MNKPAIKERIIELIDEWVISSAGYRVFWNKERATFSGEGSAEGVEVKREQINEIVKQQMKEIEGPIYLYRCRDDYIVSFERDIMEKLANDEGDFTESEIQEFYDKEMDGLFIGWD